MNRLAYLFLVISVVSALSCNLEGYTQYLEKYSSKCGGDCAAYKEAHYKTFEAQCKKLQYKRLSGVHLHNETILMDWSDDELYDLGNLSIKYSGYTSLNEEIHQNQNSFSMEIPQKSFCEGDYSKHSSPENICNLSWATSVVRAAEAAVTLPEGKYFSVKQVAECISAAEGVEKCNGVHPKAIANYLLEVGLVAVSNDSEVPECNAIDEMQTYRFVPSYPEAPNAGGLMNKIAEGKPVVAMLAIDLTKLRFTTDMSAIDEPRACGAYDPTIYALVTGYKYDSVIIEESYWQITTNILPCESIVVRIPMSANMTNANYAGIAAYAFSLDLVSDTTQKPEPPTTEPPTTEPPTTEPPTTEPPTTEPPTTEPPTTEPPTTEPPTTEPPTTEPPTTEPPTTEPPTLPPLADDLSIESDSDCSKLDEIQYTPSLTIESDVCSSSADHYEIYNWPYLTSMTFGASVFSQVEKLMIHNLPLLDTITFNNYAGSNVDTIELSNLPALTTINFGFGAFANTPSLVLTDLPSLQSIVFGASSFGASEGSLTLNNLEALESIQFDLYSFDSASTLIITDTPVLKTIIFGGYNFQKVQQPVFTELPALQSLTFGTGSFIDSTSLTVKNMNALTHLIIRKDALQRITSMTLENLPALNVFKIGDNTLKELTVITLTEVPFPADGTYSKGNGSLNKSLTVTADTVSETLKNKIEASL